MIDCMNSSRNFTFPNTWGYFNEKTKTINGMFGELYYKQTDIGGKWQMVSNIDCTQPLFEPFHSLYRYISFYDRGKGRTLRLRCYGNSHKSEIHISSSNVIVCDEHLLFTVPSECLVQFSSVSCYKLHRDLLHLSYITYAQSTDRGNFTAVRYFPIRSLVDLSDGYTSRAQVCIWENINGSRVVH